MLVVRLLGGLTVTDDDVTLGAPRGRCAGLLAWLALHPGMQPRGRVAARLWPDVIDESARRSLRTALVDLRAALGPDVAGHLLGTRDEIGLGPDIRVDVRDFADAAADGRLQEALAIATAGELLPELDHEWVYEAREEHERRLAEVIERLASDAEQRGDRGAAVEYTRRLVTLDPLSEEHARSLMRRLALAEHRSAALAVFEQHRERLRSELRMVPSAATRALADEIRDGELPAAATTTAPAPAALPPTLALTADSGPRVGAEPVTLLERSHHLAELDRQLAQVRSSARGRLVLIAGEAGAGKTALVRALYERHPDVPVLEGACEALFTPRPLGPFLDIAADIGGELSALAERGPSAAELLRALSRALRSPHLVVLEDLHWADEATLDVVRLLGRRVARLPALVIATYRDEELEQRHPLRVVLGELPGTAVDRLRIEPLSPAAVHELAAGRGIDDARLHERTGGNAFFVTEVLAAEGVGDTPTTVRDAVLARAARLSTTARRLLEAVAVVPPRAELWLLERLARPELPELEACLASGMLRGEGNAIGFRHEIARVTIEEEIPPHRRVELHRAALAALVGRAEPSRLVHHAEAADDGDAVLEHAAAAGERAARLGAHREAAAHFASALEHAGALGPAEQAALLERRAFECFLILRLPEATDAYERALAAYRAAGDRRREGDVERWLSRLAWLVGDRDAAMDHALRGLRLLETLPEGRELAMAYSNVAQLQIGFEREGAIEWGERALALAERLGETGEILVHVLNNAGTAELHAGRPGGREKLERSLTLALDAGLEDHVARAYLNLSGSFLYTRDGAGAEPYLDAAIAYARAHDLEAYRLGASALKARSELIQGRWDAAVELATYVLEHPRTHARFWITPLIVIGLLGARRGDADPWGPLDEALELGCSTGDLAYVAAARAEARWLAGSPERIAEETTAALELALARGDAWTAGELCLWRRRAGLDHEATAALPAPFAAELGGDARNAAAMWTERGCPYEAALALAGGDDEDDLRASLAELERLGAWAAASVVSSRLGTEPPAPRRH